MMRGQVHAGTETTPGLDEHAALRLLVDNSTDLLARHTPDGTFVFVSPACRTLVGYEPEELVGRSSYEFFHPDDLAAIVHSHRQVLDTPDIHTVTYRFRHRDGHDVWLETTSHTVRDQAGAVIEILTMSRDVSERIEVERRLRRSEQQFRSAMANAPIGMALVDLDGRFVEVNDRLCQVLGRDADDLLAQTFQVLTHPDDLDADLRMVESLVAGDIPHYSMRKRYRHRDGRTIWAMLSVSLIRDDHEAPLHFVAQIQDITTEVAREAELQAAKERLEALAYVDELTGLPSRRSVMDDLAECLARPVSETDHDGDLAVLVIDVDHFKAVNDRFGHAEGDRVLVELAQVLTDGVGSLGTVGRLGGEEFLVVLPNTSADLAIAMAARLRSAVTHRVATPDGPVTISVGSTRRCRFDSPTKILGRADVALYRAKRAGRNRTVEYHGSFTDTTPVMVPVPTLRPSTCRRDLRSV